MDRKIKRGNRPELMWGLGLSDQLKRQVEKGVGPGFYVRNFPAGSFPWSLEPYQEEKPSAAWIPWSVWAGMPEHQRDECRSQDDTQRILIQDQDEDLEMEQVLAEGFLTVIRTPLTRPKVQDAIFRAKEVTSMYSDIYRMTEEILLERELLSRKTDQLLFLNRILASATESLDPATILLNAKDTLSLVLPIKQLNAAFWSRQSEEVEGVDVDIFLNGAMPPETETTWVEQILSTSGDLGAGSVNGFQVVHVESARRPEFSHTPKDGRLVTMPLTAGQETFGCLMLLCEPDYRLGKDQVETFRSAVNHLGLALRNALLFKAVKLRADHDALTRIYNRHSFDERLVYEIKRRRRYNHDLSLLMVDLDHFKQVNDTYGHKAGDMVLRKVGEILTKTFRSTDLAARYGGEEFVILLPHTSEKDAWNLAERVREAIQSSRFHIDGHDFMVTASIGVASVEAGALTKDDDLLLKADKALYEAKNNGRNMVVVSKLKPSHMAVQ